MVLTSDMERIETITRGDGFQIVLHTIGLFPTSVSENNN